ncbi:terpene synthase, partial [Amycolatopsis mediterranei]
MTGESTKTTCPQWSAGEAAGLLAGPFGLGTSAARIATRFAPSPGHDPAYAYLPWGDGSAAPLYCPVQGRVDDGLAAEVDRRLVAWADGCGFTGKGLEQIAGAGFGRLAMLAHTDCDDPDRLLVAAQLNAVWWAADDYYADDSTLGAAPTELP